MKLLHYRGNFGDDLNPWLWGHLLGDTLDDDPSERFLGLGTIIGSFPSESGVRHVLGAGVGYAPVPLGPERARWRFHAVRGPLSAARLGLGSDLAITDPALLVRRLPLPAVGKRHAVAFMPHHVGARSASWGPIAEEAGVRFIDPRWGPMRCLQEIRQAELLVTEAMHGAIVADAFRVPWIPVRFYDHLLDFKWHDWCASVGLEHRFERPPLGLALWEKTPSRGPLHAAVRWSRRRRAALSLRLVARSRPRLSAARRLDGLEERLIEAIERFRITRRSPTP